MTVLIEKDVFVTVSQPTTEPAATHAHIGLVEISQPGQPGPKGPPGPGVVISDTPPADPKNGTLWWESDSGILYSWYVETDGSSSQWVQVVAPTTAVAVGSADASDLPVTATGGSTARTLEDWFAGLGRQAEDPPTSTGYYIGDEYSEDPKLWKFKDRVLIGAAADYSGAFYDGTSWLSAPYPPGVGAGYMERASTLVVTSPWGGPAISAITRTSDMYEGAHNYNALTVYALGDRCGYQTTIYTRVGSAGSGGAPPTHDSGTVGNWAWLKNTGRANAAFLGYALNDEPEQFSRVLYLEMQREGPVYDTDGTTILVPGPAGSPLCEFVAKNKGTSHTSQPYQGGGGVDGIWLVAGGDPAYGGAPKNPCNTGILFMYGSTGGPNYRWNRGITFRAGSISGSDNSDADTGTSVAVEMAKQHEIRWARPDSSRGAFIRSTVGNTGEGGAITFVPGGLQFMGSDAVIAATIFTVPNTANYMAISPNIAGQPVYLQAIGTDANIPIRAVPKGTSGFLFKTDIFVTTTSFATTSAFSSRVFSNEGASALITITLPATAQGLSYAAYCADVDGIRLVAPAGSTIRVGASVSVSSGNVTSTVVGSFIELVAVNATSWVAKYSTGTWTVT